MKIKEKYWKYFEENKILLLETYINDEINMFISNNIEIRKDSTVQAGIIREWVGSIPLKNFRRSRTKYNTAFRQPPPLPLYLEKE